MDKNRFKHLMDGYLKGDLSADDKELLQRWYDSFGESESKVPELADDQSAQRLRDELDRRIRQAIAPQRINAVSRLTKPLRYIAAAMLTAALGGTIWLTAERLNTTGNQKVTAQHPALHQLETGVRQIKRVTLPDSTVVFLNANSTLGIPAGFGKERREVSLTGEAYFDVKRDTLKPFIITTASLNVKVLGTSFNVNAYEALSDARVTVDRGLVQIADQRKVLSTLKADQMLVYSRETGRFEVNKSGADQASSWRDGVVQLNQASFKELDQAMYNIYGVRMETRARDVLQTKFNYTVRASRPLEQTLEQFCEVTGKKYRKEGDRIIIY